MESPDSQLTTAQSDSPLERIGYGSCGTVWADSSRYTDIDQCPSALVLKRGDGLPDRSLANEALMQKHILSTLQSPSFSSMLQSGHQVNFPAQITFLQPTSSRWAGILPRLPSDFTACQALISERIMPLSRSSRSLIVEKFWNGPENMRDSIVDDKRNEPCLLRPYLGRRRTQAAGSGGTERKSMLKSISLRNYPLHADQIEALGLPSGEYASAMADALAFLLWEAEIDACDVEFVLARPRSATDKQEYPRFGTSLFTSGALEPHALWVLDFDCCQKLSMDTAGVQRAAERFWRNDPYYPTPDVKCQEDALLWETFKNRFLATSAKIMERKAEAIRKLPEQLIARIVETVGVYSKGVPRQG